MIKLGLIGFGGMGRMHAVQIATVPECRLVAIADIDPAQLTSGAGQQINLGTSGATDLSGVRTYTCVDEMLTAEDLDAVDICVPTPAHGDVAQECMRAGVHVLCEKPMARTLADARAMLATAEESNCILMIAQCIRFWPEYELLKQYIDDGRWGALTFLSMRRVAGVPDWGWERWYMDGRRSGGAMLDMHVHDTDFVVHTLGMPDGVFTTARKLDTGSWDANFTQFIYPAGPLVHAECNWTLASAFSMGFLANFEQGTLTWDTIHGQPLRAWERGKSESIEVNVGADNAYGREIRYFVGCVQEGRPPERCMPASSLDGLRVAFAERASAATGSVIRMEDYHD